MTREQMIDEVLRIPLRVNRARTMETFADMLIREYISPINMDKIRNAFRHLAQTSTQ